MTADAVVHGLAVQSAQVAVVVVAVALVTATLLRRRPHLAHALWLAALAKCFVPPVWSSPTGLFSWAAAERPATHRAVPPPSPSPAVAVFAAALPPRSTTPSPATPTNDSKQVDPAAVLLTAWLAGVAAVLTATVVATARLGRRVRRSAVPVPPALTALADDVRRTLGLGRPVRLVVTAADVGPALLGTSLLGTWRPTVVLPARLLGTDLRPVLAHELAHLRRGDAAVAGLQRLAVAVWWFHPLVWLMSARLTAAREGCCDEEAVAGLSLDPLAYAQMLIDVARRRRARTLALSPGVNAMRMTTARLTQLTGDPARLNRRPPRAGWAITAVAAAALLPGAAATSPATGGGPPATRPDEPAVSPIQIAVADPWAGTRPHKPVVVTVDATAADPWRVTLPNGVTVELVGGTDWPRVGKPWWKPDGSPLATAPLPPIQPSRKPDPKMAWRELVARLSGTPASAADFRWIFTPGGNTSMQPRFGPNADLMSAIVELPPKFAEGSVEVGVAAGDWHSVVETDGPVPQSSWGSDCRAVVFSPAFETGRDIVVTVTHNVLGQDRLTAVDRNGVEHLSAWAANGGSGDFSVLTARFPNLALKDVRTFRLQVRPYEWAEFHHVALRRGGATTRP